MPQGTAHTLCMLWWEHLACFEEGAEEGVYKGVGVWVVAEQQDT